jgi:GAF domain-containing protein
MEPLRSFQTVSTAYCGDIDRHKPCMYEWVSKPFGRTVFTHHAMWVNHTEIRCIEYMLRDVREALHMDVAFVSEFSEDQLVFRALEGDAESFGWREGESFPIDESYCKRVLDGRIPQVVPDAKGEDATKDLRVTTEADIGSYCAVPLVLSDGRLYGTLCCLSHEPDPWLRERDLGLMERTARWLVEQLERHGSL